VSIYTLLQVEVSMKARQNRERPRTQKEAETQKFKNKISILITDISFLSFVSLPRAAKPQSQMACIWR
jgi:hypothetical protein